MNIFDIQRLITETMENRNMETRLFERNAKLNILEGIAKAKQLIILEENQAQADEDIPGIFALPAEDQNIGFGEEDEKLDEADLDDIACSRRANELAGTRSKE